MSLPSLASFPGPAQLSVACSTDWQIFCNLPITSCSREKRYQALLAFPYCKRRKAGRGLGTRLVSDKFQNLESETQPHEENIPTEPPPNSPNQEMRRSSQRITAKQADEQRKDCMFELEQLH